MDVQRYKDRFFNLPTKRRLSYLRGLATRFNVSFSPYLTSLLLGETSGVAVKLRKNRKNQFPITSHSTLIRGLLEEVTLGCMICGDPDAKSIDHCHQTGMIRGIICQECNMGLGRFQDNLAILKSAIRYLEYTNWTK